MVALCRGVKAVDGVRGDLKGGVKAECEIGSTQIVVDRLRHADHLHPLDAEAVCDPERVFAADRDQPFEVVGRDRRQNSLDAILARERVGARAAEDRAASGEDSSSRLDREHFVVVVQHPPPTVTKPDHLIPV